MTKTLITSGFIGSYLCEHLLKKMPHMFSIDNFFTRGKQKILI